jgi:hypothetical protein
MYLTFYSVLNHSDIGKTFCNYLKKQNKEETWKFIVSSQLLEILVQKSNHKRATAQIKQILSFFVLENIQLFESGEFQNIFSNILEMKKTENLNNLYPLIIDFKNVLLPIYKNEELSKFNQTKEALELCLTYENKKMLVCCYSKEDDFVDEDFERMQFQKKDFDFFKKLELEDPRDWIETYTSEFVNLFQSFQHHLQNIKFLEIPLAYRTSVHFNTNFQETAIAILHKFFEHETLCFHHQVVDYKDDQFIVEQYLKKTQGNVRLRRMICTLKYENGTIFGIMKPLKAHDMEFLKFQDIKYSINGIEHVERGVQEFYYFGFRITSLNENESKFTSIAIVDDRFGMEGVPIEVFHQKCSEYYKQFQNGMKKAKGKKIKDFKEHSKEFKDGFPRDPFFKMLQTLNIDQSETPKQENYLLSNILENINKNNHNSNIGENFLENISPTVVKDDFQSNILDKIPNLGNDHLNAQKIVQNKLLENISSEIPEPKIENLFVQDQHIAVNKMLENFFSEQNMNEILNFGQNALFSTENTSTYPFDLDELQSPF